MSPEPVLIAGGGIVGLAFGHALKKAGIPFQIFERDPSPDARVQGWAITLHSVIPFLKQMLPEDVLRRVEATQVDPEIAVNDSGKFLFLDLTDLSTKFKIQPNLRWRVNRDRMRQALAKGLEDHVHWDKKVVDVKPGPVLVFEDGTTASGRLVVGVDGSKSTVRKVLLPSSHRNQQLPIRFTGAGVDMTPEQIKPLRDIDPLLFFGLHPGSRTFMWYSTLETPALNGTEGTPYEKYKAQINMSWPVEKPEDEVADTSAGRLAFMKERAQNFDPKLRQVWDSLPDDTEVTEIELADWECLDWDNRGGQVTLASDAAHSMTMYRGEAANHGLLDAFLLVQALGKVYHGEVAQKRAIDDYEADMKARTRPAVVLSRQACIDGHTWENLNENSAILKRRAIQIP